MVSTRSVPLCEIIVTLQGVEGTQTILVLSSQIVWLQPKDLLVFGILKCGFDKSCSGSVLLINNCRLVDTNIWI